MEVRGRGGGHTKIILCREGSKRNVYKSGFMKTVLKESNPAQEFFFLARDISKADDIKIKKNASLYYPPCTLLSSLSCYLLSLFSTAWSDLKGFCSCEIKVHMAVLSCFGAKH